MEENNYYVYLYKRKDNGNVFYIGKGRNRRDKDINGHNEYCKRIANKYGFIIERIKENLSEREALDLEIKTIDYYVNTLGYSIALNFGDEKRNRENEKFLCNHTLGGDTPNGHSRMSLEERQKRSEKWLGDKNIAKREDVREKISKHAKENNSFAKPEVIEKISKKTKERLNDPIVKKQRSDFYKAYFQTEEGKEARRKMSESRKAKHIVPSNAIKIYCIETDKIYNSFTQFGKIHGINYRKISKLFKETDEEYIEVIDKDNLLLHIKISV